MKQNPDYIVRNDETRGLRHLAGMLIRNMPFSSVLAMLSASEPMVMVRSDRNSAMLPASIVRRIVETAGPKAFHPDERYVRMSGAVFTDILEKIEAEHLSLRTRYAVIDACCVGWAAIVFTSVGDVVMEADEETVQIAKDKGASVGHARAHATMAIAMQAAAMTGRRLSRAA